MNAGIIKEIEVSSRKERKKGRVRKTVRVLIYARGHKAGRKEKDHSRSSSPSSNASTQLEKNTNEEKQTNEKETNKKSRKNESYIDTKNTK